MNYIDCLENLVRTDATCSCCGDTVDNQEAAHGKCRLCNPAIPFPVSAFSGLTDAEVDALVDASFKLDGWDCERTAAVVQEQERRSYDKYGYDECMERDMFADCG